jgi:hypothetical protein
MHLVACQTPQEPLEDAPMSALLTAELASGDRWESFWSSDAYFVRCTRKDGAVEWFMVADDEAAQDDAGAARRSAGTRVIEFPLRRMQTRVVIAKGPDGRGMLVGSARRTSHRSTARRAGE